MIIQYRPVVTGESWFWNEEKYEDVRVQIQPEEGHENEPPKYVVEHNLVGYNHRCCVTLSITKKIWGDDNEVIQDVVDSITEEFDPVFTTEKLCDASCEILIAAKRAEYVAEAKYKYAKGDQE